MERRDCDAIVLFGATGDLCYKKIYPALYHLARRGQPAIDVGDDQRVAWLVCDSAAALRQHANSSSRRQRRRRDRGPVRHDKR